MLALLDDMIRRHRHSGLLVDANLLLVFLLASWDIRIAVQFKRTRGYDVDDIDALKLILSEFDRLVVTPSVLAEVSNLSSHLDGGRKEAFFRHLVGLLPSPVFEERLVPLGRACGAPSFIRLGYTDATVDELGFAGVPVLTDDLDLYVHLVNRGIEAFNFTQLRALI